MNKLTLFLIIILLITTIFVSGCIQSQSSDESQINEPEITPIEQAPPMPESQINEQNQDIGSEAPPVP